MDAQFMKKALEEAQIRRGFCAPNPSVGAVVVKDGKILSTGHHWGPGCFHAEAEALNQLSADAAKDSTVYVSLEPCSTWGRTPPCTSLLTQKRVSKVYYGYVDPNPNVSGRGAEILNDAGIQCQLLPLAEIDSFYESYKYWTENALPWTTVKLAMSLDGKIAGIGGSTIRISGKESVHFTHEMRKNTDAILTTGKTIRNDNPRFNVRLEQEILRKPVFVVDSRAEIPLDSNVIQTAKKLIVFHSALAPKAQISSLESLGVQCVEIEKSDGGLNLLKVTQKIAQSGVHDLWVEAGGSFVSSLAKAGQINRVYLYVAPKWLGKEYQSAFSDEMPFLAQAKSTSWSAIGRDAVCELIF